MARRYLVQDGTATTGKCPKFNSSGDLVDGMSIVAGTVCEMNPFATSSDADTAHGLGAMPTMLVGKLICKTAELGYTAGDAIALPPFSITYAGSGGGSRGLTFGADSTNCFIRTAPDLTQITRKDTNAVAAITAANWRIEVTPYLITL